MITEHRLKLPQGSFAFLSNEHQPDNQDLLAIHGWLDNAASFLPLIQALPEYNWTAIDLPGHGHSFHRPKHSHYHFIDWVSDMVDVIRAKYSQPVTLVGHSLGGMLASVIAGLYPELVKSVVLIDAAGLVTQSPDDGAAELRAALDSRDSQKEKSDKVDPTPVQMQVALRARAMAGNLSEASAKKLIERNVKQIEGHYFWRSDTRLRSRSPIRMNVAQASSVLNNITAPVLLLLAKEGYPEIKQNFSRFNGCYQNLLSLNVDGSHHCHMDNAYECAQLISKFLK